MKQHASCKRPILYSLLLFAGIAVSAMNGAAIPAFADSFDAGRFMIDIPDGYHPAPQQSDAVFNFAGPGPRLIAVFNAEEDDLRKGFEDLVKLVGGSFTEFSPGGDMHAMDVNGHPAMMGIYIGKVQSPESGLVSLYNLLGVVLLESRGCLSFFASYAGTQRSEWEGRVRETFFSIRAVGEPVTGVMNRRRIVP